MYFLPYFPSFYLFIYFYLYILFISGSKGMLGKSLASPLLTFGSATPFCFSAVSNKLPMHTYLFFYGDIE
jgi:hypothetical protein